MNKTKLKSYAPQARKDFINAVTARANLLGIFSKAGKLEVVASQPRGDATVIAGQAWPVKVHSQRQQLIARIEKEGFDQTMEAVAYTWFNRFAALRYMELHDYLSHGHRALSSAEGMLPDILTHATDLVQANALPGLNSTQVVDMTLAGNRDGELYRLLLIAQCNVLSNVMPFLFERIDDETELLLPDNLLRTDSVIAKLVSSIEEDEWKEVEIIGWLYQFYISDKKDEVIGNVVKSEDIPAATQLFTPNWIVKYLVQNSIGRLWLMANPTSTLKVQWPYYITPADQTLEVQEQLDGLIQARVNYDGESLNPESITLLDPACGSGHILVEAYEVLKAIYLERGYQPRAIPRLIIEKNLYGLDIDDRAAQMAGFALVMKARADDRRLFNEPIKLNVLSLQESKGLDAEELARALQTGTGGVSPQIADGAASNGFCEDDLFPGTRPQFSLGEASEAGRVGSPIRPAIASLIATFADAKTLGSLIQIPQALNAQLASLDHHLRAALQNGDLYAKAAAHDLGPLVAQARVLGMKVDAVVANPPYMGNKGMNSALKNYVKVAFADTKADLFAAFIERGFAWCKPAGFNSMVTMQSWMFLSSYESMREKLLRERTLLSMLHMGNGVMGIAFGTAATIMLNHHVRDYAGAFCNCDIDDVNTIGVPTQFPVQNKRMTTVKPDDFVRIPGSPIAYWISQPMLAAFSAGDSLGTIAAGKHGMSTGNNNLFVRRWHEVSLDEIGLQMQDRASAASSEKKWFPYNKGGAYRKWYGNHEFVVNYKRDGYDMIAGARDGSNTGFRHDGRDSYFKQCVSWSFISASYFGVRYYPSGFVFDVAGSAVFPDDKNIFSVTGFLCSKIAPLMMEVLNPTVNFQVGNVVSLPFLDADVEPIVKKAIEISKNDWDNHETSWNFTTLPFLGANVLRTLESSWANWNANQLQKILCLKDLEEENNRVFINAYCLEDEISPEVLDSQITLTLANRVKDCQRLISYAIGCMMGRYSLDVPGLIYAKAGNVDFDVSRYTRLPADTDGIVPITDELWFEDDAASRVSEFLLALWSADTLVENMAWLAESLNPKVGETPDETIRSYLADKFYKDHLQTYKKRPIYWLFSSGRQGAFQALVYVHRYHEGTLARMRAEYVVPLTGKINSRIDMLEKDLVAAASTAARNKLTKEVEKLKKKHVELLAYDEQLRHYADMRITLDLDDGVKVNYSKFGNLLAEVKAVTGGAIDD